MTPQAGPLPRLSLRRWGQIFTPRSYTNTPSPGRLWCMDNDVFSGRFYEQRFWRKLARMESHRPSCVFVVAPDVVANAIATLDAFRYWGPRIKAAGWPVAFVAQDGQELFDFPPEFDALFVGGSTAWKMSPAARACIARAKTMGKWTHVGRVNSQKRIRHFMLARVNSVDGTGLVFAPDKNYPVLDKQLRQLPLMEIG